MSNSIFYSWQGDRPSKVCRNLIENALRDAVERIAADTTIDAAIRDGVEVDKDTKNVPGSPAIFDTILEKIADASIVVADLTFVGQRENGKQIPNPNVLIEYGFALNDPGPPRMIGVMNTAFGHPTSENMPFNLALNDSQCSTSSEKRMEQISRSWYASLSVRSWHMQSN